VCRYRTDIAAALRGKRRDLKRHNLETLIAETCALLRPPKPRRIGSQPRKRISTPARR
jgi:hypothetical protein